MRVYRANELYNLFKGFSRHLLLITSKIATKPTTWNCNLKFGASLEFGVWSFLCLFAPLHLCAFALNLSAHA
jgi:hypothetical protein